MLFNSIDFLIFFPIVVILYVIIPARFRQLWLLVCSYFFYMCWNPRYIVLILFSTVITYLAGILIDKTGHKKIVLVACIILNLAILFVFKYLNFALSTVGTVFRFNAPVYDIILPVGISFYIFQALGYVIDCYRGDVEAEHNFLRYALFVSFFPQLVAGPIERSRNLLGRIRAIPDTSRREILDGERIRAGLILMVWGMFMKLVIADRIAILVDTIYSHYYIYGSVGLLMGLFGFSIQIYCDFAGYSTIAVGAAQVIGIELMENFTAPYLSVSMTEFWRRWHISLSSWFRDYVYIPLGGNRHGRVRKIINTLITFTVSGLWHGADWTFVFWGALHGCLLSIEEIFRPLVRRVHKAFGVDTSTTSFRLCRAAVTFTTAGFAWVFFRASSIGDAFAYIGRIFTRPDWWHLSDGTIYTYGLDVTEMWILALSLAVLFTVDLIRVRCDIRFDKWIMKQYAGFRIVFVALLIVAIVVYGEYGYEFNSQQFIYFQF